MSLFFSSHPPPFSLPPSLLSLSPPTLFYLALGIESKTSHMLVKYSAADTHPWLRQNFCSFLVSSKIELVCNFKKFRTWETIYFYITKYLTFISK